MAVDNSKWGILYCPKSGTIRPNKRWKKIEKYLLEYNIDYDFIQSENSSSVERLVKMLINNDYKTIIIVGGDSALNDTVNCLMQTPLETRNQIAIGIIPNGMMNDFAHFWNIHEGDEKANIAWLKEHRVRKIDLGCIQYKNKSNESCRRYFLNCINIGLIATIMNLRKKTLHIFGSRVLSFVFSFILMIFQRLEYYMHILINTDEIKRNVMTMCIGNATGYGQTPNGNPYNGLLDVSVVYQSRTTQLFEGIYLFLRGKFLNYHSVHSYRTESIDVKNIGKAFVGIDGRLMKTPKGEFKINVEKEVINFLIPK